MVDYRMRDFLVNKTPKFSKVDRLLKTQFYTRKDFNPIYLDLLLNRFKFFNQINTSQLAEINHKGSII